MNLKSIARLAISVLFLTTGILHLLHPLPFMEIVPRCLPAPKILVIISGICEIAGGVGLLIPQFRKPATIGLLLLLMAVLPANIYMATSHPYMNGHRILPLALWLRLPLQPLLMALIWWSATTPRPKYEG
ncbi:MAG: MauE/DoxX family redox-associated membrane protein [Chthoniobacterales bacterium]